MEENTYQHIHTVTPTNPFTLQALWLLIPAMVFVALLIIFVQSTPRQYAAADSAPVLGEQSNEE